MTARWLIIIGILLIGLGLSFHFAPWLFNWFGKLPGDIRIDTDNFKFYLPLGSMIVISIVLSLVLTLIFSFFKS
ncbi:MAG: hypothetical protein APR63_07865 [Desulfuromonas sp. SDB]|nr:MAG: hypothetical protein APR63_07865 [Desulfuromonas sp. SDB]